MPNNQQKLAKSLIKTIPKLSAGQLYWLERIVAVFSAKYHFSQGSSDLFDDFALRNFGDAIRVHHSFSAEPFSKDKFEYIFVKVLNASGHSAVLAPKGNPGHDITVDGVKISLKTQADKGIKDEKLWISKFMELGKGQWGKDPADLVGLRNQFLNHLKNYDRILSLRALSKDPTWKYELVEIPKRVLDKAKDGTLEMMIDSKQLPKPGYCYVRNSEGGSIFDLYFDAGSERKLQIKNLKKEYCTVHAVWEFTIPTE